MKIQPCRAIYLEQPNHHPELSPKYNLWYWFWKTGKLLKREVESGSWKDLNILHFKKRGSACFLLLPWHTRFNFHFSFPKCFSKYLSSAVSTIRRPPSSRTVSPEAGSAASSPAGRGPTITTAMQLDLSLLVICRRDLFKCPTQPLWLSVYMQA